MKKLYRKLSVIQKRLFWILFIGLFIFGSTQIRMSQVNGLLTALGLRVETVTTIQNLENYSGSGNTINVTDTLRGGNFNYVASGLVSDSGTVFPANGKGGGFWKRQRADKYNILWFGASSTASSSANTAAINEAIKAALLRSGGLVYIPANTYLVDSINWDSRVSIKGDGVGSVLKSNSAISMFGVSMAIVNNDIPTAGTFSNILLDGDSIGTVGLNMFQVAKFSFNDVFVRNFTVAGANMVGCLIGQFTNCRFLWCGAGIISNHSTLEETNLVTFQSCQFTGCKNWGMSWEGGSGLVLNSCDFEGNGISASTTTGSFNFQNSRGAMGFTLRGCWFEGNNGVNVNIGTPTLNSTPNVYFIENCKMGTGGAGNTYGIQMANGVSASSFNTLYLVGTFLGSFGTKDISIDGAYAKMIIRYSSYITATLTNGATVDTYTFIRATGTYRNYVPGDYLFYSPNDNLSFLVDNGTKKVSFAVGVNTPALSIYNNYINAQVLTLGTATLRYGYINIPANLAAAGGAGITFGTGGVVNTTPINGAMEYASYPLPTPIYKLYLTYAAGRTPLLDSTTASATFAPKGVSNQTTLVAGTKAISVAGVTTSSTVQVTQANGSSDALTTHYQGVCTSGTLTINAITSAGNNTVNTADVSTINYTVTY